jgi:hypothetical protein
MNLREKLLALFLTLFCLQINAAEPATAKLSAGDIMAQATAAAGGDAWRYAETNLMTGDATLYRDGRATLADRYEMRRVYPKELPAAHTNTGKFRLDAWRGEALLFTISYDGEQMYNQSGPMPEEQARNLAASSFGFSAVRFALDDTFNLQRMPDDQVEGHPSYFVQVTDPAGGTTLVGVGQSDYAMRYVGWQTPRGWHHRLYSGHYTLDSGFVQPGRVRLYYDGIKTADINWRQAVLNTEIPGSLFSINPDTE